MLFNRTCMLLGPCALLRQFTINISNTITIIVENKYYYYYYYYKELAKRLTIAKSYDEYEDMIRKVNSTGMYADIGNFPWFLDGDNPNHAIKFWYQSSETIGGDYPYILHLANKKWPLLKVC